jgi:DNA helicase-2/ATP-dependent DNA helicase PcrA
VVFVTGMEEGLFPHSRSIQDGDVEEERRLAYVGITRAREQLTLVHAQSRSVFGRRQYNTPSRFLDELPDEHITRDEQAGNPASWGGQSGGSAWGRSSGGSSGSTWGSTLDDSSGALGSSGWKQSRGQGQRRSGGGDEFGATFGGKAGSGSGSKGWGSGDGTSASGASGTLFGSGASESAQRKRIPRPAGPQLSVGDRVRHGTFGEGIVLQSDGADMAVIRFEDGTERRLMLSYAPIERISE